MNKIEIANLKHEKERLKHENIYLKDKQKLFEKKFNKLKSNINNKSLDLAFKPDFSSRLNLLLNKILKKKKLNIVFIGDNKEISFKYIFYDSKNFFTIKDKSYTFNETHFYMYKGIPLLFIYENQPIPCDFNIKTEIDSTILNDIMKSKFIVELLHKDEGILGMDLNKNTLILIAMILGALYLFSQGFLDDIFKY